MLLKSCANDMAATFNVFVTLKSGLYLMQFLQKEKS